MRSRLVRLMVPLLWSLGAAPVAGQQSRAELIDAARAEADGERQLTLLMEAAEPTVLDSLWAASVYEIAQVLMLDQAQDALAETWLRWAVRHGQPWPLDPIWISPSMVPIYESVAAAVTNEARAESGEATTSWRWPDTFTPSESGTMEVSPSDPSVPITVLLNGEALAAGRGTVAPGSYEVLVIADGYESVRARREVLPGVSTVVTVEMVPVLSDAVASRVGRSLVGVRLQGVASATCTNGLVWRPGLVITSLSALPATTGLEVVTPDGAFGDVSVVETDPSSDIAILRVGTGTSTSMEAARPSGQTFAWSVFRSTCAAEPEVLRTRLTGFGEAGGLQASSTPSGALGAPLVDRDGAVLGLIVRGGEVVPISLAEQLVDQALAQLDSGGFPVAWVTLGVAAAGAAAAFLLGGGGPDPGPGPDTGGVVIVIPF